MECAQTDLAMRQSELEELEREFLASSGVAAIAPTNSIEGLATALSNILTEMKSGGLVPEPVIDEATGHMSLLMAGVTKIAEEVKKLNKPAATATGAATRAASPTTTGNTPPAKATRVKHTAACVNDAVKNIEKQLASSPTKND